jgi:hypothetical protein
MKTRFSQYFDITELYVASFLDPRFRSLNFIPAVNKRKEVLKKIMSYLGIERLRIKVSNPSPIMDSIDTPTPAKKVKTFSIYDNISTSNVSKLDLDDEISNYSNMNIALNENSSPLDFYKLHGNQFPILSDIAKKIFSISPTSVPSERLFSKAGELISLKRNRIKPNSAEKITILDQSF